MDVYDWVTAFPHHCGDRLDGRIYSRPALPSSELATHPGLRVGVKAILWVQHGDAPRFVLGEQNCTVEHPNFLY